MGQLPSVPGLVSVLPKVAPPATFSPIRAGAGFQVSMPSARWLPPGQVRLLGFAGQLQVGLASLRCFTPA